MSSQENNNIAANDNTVLKQEKKWGELLQLIEHEIESNEVQDQVEVTSWAIVYGLLPWNILNPAGEVARLMKLREPANDTTCRKVMIPANDNNSQNVVHDNSRALKKAA